MRHPEWPTFGQMLDYLRGLGFTTRKADDMVFAEHPEEDDTWFTFRDRPLDEPARGIELVDLRFMLDQRGFVEPQEFAYFWTEYGPVRRPEPKPAPPEPTPAT